jgi:hypothetical protein
MIWLAETIWASAKSKAPVTLICTESAVPGPSGSLTSRVAVKVPSRSVSNVGLAMLGSDRIAALVGGVLSVQI